MNVHTLLEQTAQALAPLLRRIARKSSSEYFDPVQFLLFCCVGILNALVDFFVYVIAIRFLSIYVSSIIAWIVACCFSYAINKRWIFHTTTKGALPFARFITVGIFSQGLRIGLLYLLTAAGLGEIIAYILTAPVVALANYLGYKLWSFKEP